MSTPAPPAGNQGSTVPPPTLSLAEPLPHPLSRVMRRLKRCWRRCYRPTLSSRIFWRHLHQPIHVKVGIYTPDEDDESTGSEFGDRTQQSPVPSTPQKTPGFCGEGHRLPRFFAFCGSELFGFLQCGSEHAPSKPQVRVSS